jgi:hypothetical protein
VAEEREESNQRLLTAPSDSGLRSSRRGRLLRRAFLFVLVVIVALGLAGFWGVRSRSVSAQTARKGGYELSVRYAQVARAGLGVPLEFQITRRRGFDDPVKLAVSSSYLDLFDRNAIDPDPSDATTAGQNVVWTFDPPKGKTLQVSIDAEVQKGRHWGREGRATVLDADEKPLVSVTFHTWLVP